MSEAKLITRGGRTTRFGRIKRPAPTGGYEWYQVAACGVCAKTNWIKDGTSGGMPPEAAGKKFQAIGWQIGTRASRDLCPACSKGNVRVLSPAQKRAAYLRIAGVEKKEPESVAVEQIKPVPVGARSPTITDKRRIMDALDHYYDLKLGRYSLAWTDEGLAQKLDVPRSWITEVREGFFGAERNQAQEERDGAIVKLEKEFEAAFAKMADLENQIKKLRG